MQPELEEEPAQLSTDCAKLKKDFKFFGQHAPTSAHQTTQQTRNGRVGAINLEQLDVLLESLKSYWDYSNQKSILAEIKASPTTTIRAENELAYEL